MIVAARLRPSLTCRCTNSTPAFVVTCSRTTLSSGTSTNTFLQRTAEENDASRSKMSTDGSCHLAVDEQEQSVGGHGAEDGEEILEVCHALILQNRCAWEN